MSEPYDLNALELEDDDLEPFVFIFGDEEFTIPPHIDPRLFRRASKGDLDGVLLSMIGEEQYARLDKIDQPFDERHLLAVFTAWTEHDATSMGEASASSSSSKSTGRPSKRTSKGSTTSRSRASSPDISTAPLSGGDDSESS